MEVPDMKSYREILLPIEDSEKVKILEEYNGRVVLVRDSHMQVGLEEDNPLYIQGLISFNAQENPKLYWLENKVNETPKKDSFNVCDLEGLLVMED